MRRQISLLVAATTSAVVVSFVVPLCLLVSTLAEDRAMATADQEARNVALLVASIDDPDRLASLVSDLDNDDGTVTQVLTADGRQLGAGPEMSGDDDVDRARDGEAFTVVDGDGGQVLLPIVGSDGTAVVRSVVAEEELRRGVREAWVLIIGLGAVLLATALVIALRMGRRISEPLRGVAGTAHRLREGDLAARAEVRGTEETQELASALNGLAERTTELLSLERAAVGELSHRLRTPVTALRLDAEAVDQPEVAERLQTHVATLQRTIDAIVNEARRPVRADLASGCDAAATVRERLEFWRPLADDQGRRLDAVLPDTPVPVPLDLADLTDLIDVLVDNVFAHTPEGTAFRVELHHDPTARSAVLRLTDEGPGFGVRVPRVGSTGLGLDIAARTAAGVGGSLRVDTPAGGGAVVEVILPTLGGLPD